MKKEQPIIATYRQSVDTLIGKFGLAKTIEVINNLSGNAQLKSSDTQKVKLLVVYFISQSIQIFDLQEPKFYTSNIQEYRDARMACYFLLKKYTDTSYAKIGESFKQSKRAVMYNYHKCDEILSIPSFYKPFVAKFQVLENNVVNFIAKLN